MMRNSISFKTCLKFSNSVCDLLIVSLQTPSLIIILVYRPPSCPVKDFEEISLKIHTYVMSLPSPLPNIILLGDFNLPEINWSSLNPNCPTAGSLLSLTSLTFLNQQVSEPTRNCNIIDIIFCPDNIINFITVSDTFFFDHRVIYAETLIPVHDSSTVQIDQNLNPPSTHIEILDFNKSNWPKLKDSSTVQIDQNLNPPSTHIEILDFNKSNWPKLKESLNTIDWPTTFCGIPANVYIDVAIDTISEKCTLFVPQKQSKK